MKAEIYKDVRGEWRWRIKARNHKTMADSGEGYSSRRKCWQALAKLGRIECFEAIENAVAEASGK